MRMMTMQQTVIHALFNVPMRLAMVVDISGTDDVVMLELWRGKQNPIAAAVHMPEELVAIFDDTGEARSCVQQC